MINNKDIHPERNIYYLGAILLDVIKASKVQQMDFFSLFEKFREKEKLSIDMFTLTLDWLFLLGLLKNNNGQIKKCF